MIALVIRAIGIPACLVIGLLFFYEGIPGASRIPFLTSIPVIGDLTTGRVATERAKAAADARRTYVDAMEKAALAAQLAERDRQQAIGAIALEEYRKRLAAAQSAEQAASDQLEKEISENEKALEAAGRACRADQSDLDFILR
jgi:hypothetical protein